MGRSDKWNIWSLNGVSFIDVSNGTIVGECGTILRTTNGGLGWANQTSGTTLSLTELSFIDANNGWAVGDYGTILHTTNGGVSFVEEDQFVEMPIEFLLSQNYPNPFNPSTKISWQVPVGGWQTLKIYDVLGNEVATLVDEYKPAGKYEVEFSPASSIKYPASGVYFYQLKAGEYIETRKMILVK